MNHYCPHGCDLATYGTHVEDCPLEPRDAPGTLYDLNNQRIRRTPAPRWVPVAREDLQSGDDMRKIEAGRWAGGHIVGDTAFSAHGKRRRAEVTVTYERLEGKQ